MSAVASAVALKIDHIGVAVEDLEASLAYYCQDLGYRWEGVVLTDPLQMVRLTFVHPPGGGIKFELLQPTAPASPLAGSLRRRIRFVHVCYEVDDLQQALDRFVAQGGRVISEPQPGAAFQGRRAAFVFTRDREVIELAESRDGRTA